MAKCRYGRRSLALTSALVAGCVLIALPLVNARSTRSRILSQLQGCRPNDAPQEKRCAFVREHPECMLDDGWIPYLEVHYCYLAQREWASTALFLLWIGLLFGLMLMVAERFFCPSLEVIAEYLRLPPCVAGATLLSFGNGAPDVFTQLAAISKGDGDSSSPEAIAMALSEPLGSGLFVGNIVFALVLFFSGAREVRVQRWYFLKDCLFYLAGVATVLAFLLHGVVTVWEVALLGCIYVAFMAATILLARGDEPVHADPRLHEVPHRLQPLDSFLRESYRRGDGSVRGGFDSGSGIGGPSDVDFLLNGYGNGNNGMAAPLLYSHPEGEAEEADAIAWDAEEASLLGLSLLGQGAVSNDDNGGLHVTCGAGNASGRDGNSRHAEEPVQPLAPKLLVIADTTEATAAPPSMATVTAVTAVAGTTAMSDAPPFLVPPDDRPMGLHTKPLPTVAVAALLESDGGGGGDGCSSNSRAAGDAAPAVPAAAAITTKAVFPVRTEASGDGGVGWGDEGGVMQCGRSGGDSALSFRGGVGGSAFHERSAAPSPASLRRQDSGRPPGRVQQLWRKLERPGLAMLSIFMPRIAATETHARYRKTYALLLPPLLPTLLAASQGWLAAGASPGALWQQSWWRAATCCGLVVSLAVLRYYPRKGHLHGYAAGIATVVVFCEAMFLLNVSAGELVSAALALGQIYGISASLLAATLLAWGNSVSDLVSNITLARDGLPSMAITACFASPLFVLLAGLVTSLTYATRHGDMELPRDLALRVLYGSSAVILLMWAIVVPLVFRFRLSNRVGVLAVVVYLVYQCVYIAAIMHDARA